MKIRPARCHTSGQALLASLANATLLRVSTVLRPASPRHPSQPSRGMTLALCQLAWAHLKAVEPSCLRFLVGRR
jgi:hypothetical protein